MSWYTHESEVWTLSLYLSVGDSITGTRRFLILACIRGHHEQTTGYGLILRFPTCQRLAVCRRGMRKLMAPTPSLLCSACEYSSPATEKREVELKQMVSISNMSNATSSESIIVCTDCSVDDVG